MTAEEIKKAVSLIDTITGDTGAGAIQIGALLEVTLWLREIALQLAIFNERDVELHNKTIDELIEKRKASK